MEEALIASLLAFFAGVIVGVYLGKRRWDKNIQEEDDDEAEPTEQRRVRTGAWSDTILVDTRIGKHFFALEYLRSHSRQELAHELAYGNIVHDEKWDGKIKEADNGND